MVYLKISTLVLALLACGVAANVILPHVKQIEKRLIRFNENETPEWLTQIEVEKLVSKHVNFMDITDQPKSGAPKFQKVFDIPTTLRFPTEVQAAISKLSTDRMIYFLNAFSSYYNRYYTTESGVASSQWLMSQIQHSIDSNYAYAGNATVSSYLHTGWPQLSLIARIEGTNSTPVVILGAHLDSVTSGATGAAPGADDNGTGSTLLLETFAALLETGFVPKTTIEFHWYAAEEVGLRGSQDIALAYSIQGIDVVSVVNFDMSGYLSPQSRIGLVTDFTDPELNSFLRKVIDAYSEYDWLDRTCGYACSDHATWHGQGVRAAFAHEDGSNPYVHTINDTTQFINFNHVLEFAKLATGYIIEISEPVGSA